MTDRKDMCDCCLQAPGARTCDRCQQYLCEDCGQEGAEHDCRAPDQEEEEA